MTDITLVRTTREAIDPKDADAARRVLFGMIDGLSEADSKSWRRVMNWLLNKAQPGEMLQVEIHQPRSLPFHKYHFALQQKVFRSQERIATFRAFRSWTLTAVGYCEWTPGPKGGVIPIPKSESFKDCPEEVIRELHADIVTFFRTSYCQHFLWPHLSADLAQEMMETVLLDMDA